MGAKFEPLGKGQKTIDIIIDTKFVRRKLECTICDHKRSVEILEDLQVEPVDKDLRRYKSNLLRYVTATRCHK
jgi:hypothetical protein